MANIIRSIGLVCAMLVATISLYFCTMFWTGMGSNTGSGKNITDISEQATNLVTPIKKFYKEKLSYLKRKV